MPRGLYIHVPFCASKCPYCDFYSISAGDILKEKYVFAVCRELDKHSEQKFDTVYFGGGTPSQLRADDICKILSKANVVSNAEITMECNPSDCYSNNGFDFEKVSANGINRISMGLQSVVESERKILGRRSGKEEIEKAIKRIKSSGIDNISLDIMLGISGQTTETLKKSIDFCLSSDVKHISAYLLKIEEGTFYHKNKSKLNLPDEDETAELYLKCCELIEQSGMKQYEISNFAFSGYESRHNLKYWHDEEYLGIGPAAHSFIDGRRFYYSRDLESFIDGCAPNDDGNGGNFEEYVMLALRLCEGLRSKNVKEKFGYDIPKEMICKAQKLTSYGLTTVDEEGIKLTTKGFLLSNSVIAELIL